MAAKSVVVKQQDAPAESPEHPVVNGNATGASGPMDQMNQATEQTVVPAKPEIPKVRAVLERPRVERWCQVPDYPGYEVKLWINYDQQVRTRLTSAKDSDTLMQVYQEIVLEHNGWPDAEGNVLPQPWQDIEGFVGGMDQYLSSVVATMLMTEPMAVPKSMLPNAKQLENGSEEKK